MHEPGAGSSGTKTQCFQFLKGSDIIIKNGVVRSDDVLKMVMQNYSNLTLDNVKVYGGAATTYVLSNNFGNVVLKNKTELHSTNDKVAFDVYFGMSDVYYDGVSVTIADNTVVIDGKVEFGKAGRAPEELFRTNAVLTIPTEMDLNIVNPPQDWGWRDNQDGTKTFAYLG